MSLYKAFPCLLLACNAVAAEGFIVGGGLEGDSADGLSVSVIGEVGLTEKTWLSGVLAKSTVDVGPRGDIDSLYADIGLDYWFDPIGFRAGLSYWGDSDSLDSTDWRASLYWRSDRFTLAGDYEFRDFRFDFPSTDQFPGRTASFEATGVGLSSRFKITDSVSFGLSSMGYDYDVNLQLDANRPILELLSFSRLSLINSLVDYRANATLGIDVGEQSWELDIGSWKGEVDRASTRSATLRLLNPIGNSADIEFALGVDDSELYGNVTFFSVFLYFYGGL